MQRRCKVDETRRGKSFTIEPGPICIDGDLDTGCVHKVNPGSQAENLGIRTKMTIKAVDGLPYSEKILRAKVAGDVPFELTFKWVERMEEECLEYTSGSDVSLMPSPQRCTPSGAVSSSSVHKCSPPHWDSWEAEIPADHEGHADVAEKPTVETAENDTSDDPRKELLGSWLLIRSLKKTLKISYPSP